MRQRIISLFFIALGMLFGSNLMGQQEIIPDQGSCDCLGRKLITDTLIKVPFSPPGPGRVMEFLSEPKDPFSFEIEHHTLWMEFKAPGNCLLEMDIIPDDTLDNLDFLLFTYYTTTTCDSIGDSWIPAIRSVVSANEPALMSRTGLSDTAIDLNIAQGQDFSYARALQVRKGHRYVLVVDNERRNGSGFTIHLKYKNCGLAPGEKPVPVQPVRLVLTDTLGSKLTGHVFLRQRYARSEGPDTAILASGHSLIGELTQSTYYEITATVPGYLYHKELFRTTSRKDTLIKVVMLKEIEVGSSELFSPIYFRKNSDKFDVKTTDALKQSVKLLKDNPAIRIEIQGHVNRPENIAGWIGDTEDKSLGELRAKAVEKYLVRKGIDKDRIEIRNMKNTDMVYPYAKNQEQMAENRRAEILVIKAK